MRPVAFAVAFALAACGDGGDPDPQPEPDAGAGADADGTGGGDVSAPDAAEDAGVPAPEPEPDPEPECLPTEADLENDYLPGAPETTNLAGLAPGDHLQVLGHVYGPDCATPVGGATIEVWQPDQAGAYHPDQLRATLHTDGEGVYGFETLRPAAYMFGDGWRPAHVHFKVSAAGFAPLTTQLYFEGDPYVQPYDACKDCKSGDEARIVPVVESTPGLFAAEFTIVLAAD